MTTQQLLKRLGLTIEIPRYYLKAALSKGFHPVAALALLARALRKGYWPSEAYRIGLLNRNRADFAHTAHASKRRMVQLQRKLNPSEWESVVADKSIFYRFCAVAGIPTPRLIAIFHRHRPGWSEQSPVINSLQQWETVFLSECPPEFVIKPALGHHGLGVRVLVRQGNKLVAPGGEQFTPESLLEHLTRDREFDSFVVQQRIRNHPLLKPIAPGEGLSTSRLVTMFHRDGSCRILLADLKINHSRNLTSNFSVGMTGNLAATVSVENGQLLDAYTVVDGYGFREVLKHPETQETIAGFQIPMWQETCALVYEAARKFLPVRTIGWDVVYTPDGPMILEGNFWYDPPNSSQRAPAILAEITGGM